MGTKIVTPYFSMVLGEVQSDGAEGIGGRIDLQLVLARGWLDGGGLPRASGQPGCHAAV